MRSIASLLGGNHEEIERNIVHAAGKAIKTMNEQNQNVQPASAQQYYPNPPPEEATAVEMSPMNQIPEQEPPREMKRAQTVPPNALRPFIPPFMRDNTVNPASNADPNNVVDDANSSVETTKKNTKKTNTVLATQKQKKREIRLKTNWDIANTMTIIDWISTSNMNILIFDMQLQELRQLLKANTLLSLLISSITSTISVTQFTINDTEQPLLSLVIKVSIFITSVVTSIITGWIKVEKIQEKMEQIDSNRTKWLNFMIGLTSQLQVGNQLRSDAVDIIKNNQELWNKLNAKTVDIPSSVRMKVSQTLIDAVWTKFRAGNQGNHRNQGCCHIMCCARRKLYADQVKHTRRKLGIQYSTNKLLIQELENLQEVFFDLIESLVIDKNAKDVFDQKLTVRRYQEEQDELDKQRSKSFERNSVAVPLGYPYYDNSSISSAEKKNPHLGPLFKSVAAVTPKKSLREAKVQFLSTHLKRHRSRRRRRYSFNSVRSVSSISPEFGSSSRSRSVSPTSGSRQNVNSQTNLEEDPRINSIVPGKQPSPRNITVTRVKEIGGEVGDNTVGRNVPPPEDKNVPAEEEQNQEQNLEP